MLSNGVLTEMGIFLSARQINNASVGDHNNNIGPLREPIRSCVQRIIELLDDERRAVPLASDHSWSLHSKSFHLTSKPY